MSQLDGALPDVFVYLLKSFAIKLLLVQTNVKGLQWITPGCRKLALLEWQLHCTPPPDTSRRVDWPHRCNYLEAGNPKLKLQMHPAVILRYCLLCFRLRLATAAASAAAAAF